MEPVVGPGDDTLEAEAASHFEAMTLYCEHLGRGVYTTDQDWDRQPYPDEWRHIQLGEGR
jgi:hypothetical protein